MCMCTYFLFQCIDVCTVSKCFYTEPFPLLLLLSLDVGRLPMMTSEWRERKEERERERAREERRGYTFCVILLEEKEEKIVHLFH